MKLQALIAFGVLAATSALAHDHDHDGRAVTYDFTSCCGNVGEGYLATGPDTIAYGTLTFNLPHENVAGGAPFSVSTSGGSPLVTMKGYDAAGQLVFSTADHFGAHSVMSTVSGGFGVPNNGSDSGMAMGADTISKHGISSDFSASFFGSSIPPELPIYNRKGDPVPFTSAGNPITVDTEVEVVVDNAAGKNITNDHFSFGSLVLAASNWWGNGDHGKGGGSGGGGGFSAPEIDPSSAVSALTLLLGALAVLRGRRRA